MKTQQGSQAENTPFILTTTAHWKALAHPLRASILRLLAEQSLTNEELADRIGVESGKLYFHTKHLLDAGLIEIAETRSKGPITEKVYRAVARFFMANGLPDTQEGDPPPFDSLVFDMQALYRQAWQDNASWAGKAHYAYHYTHHIPTEHIREFITEMKALVEKFQAIRTDDTEATEYAFGMVLHALPPDQQKKK